MKEYERLKSKWRTLIENNQAGACFDSDKLTPGKFCVHIVDQGGTMACMSHVKITGFFDSKKDALAHYRFTEIPRILDWDRGVCKDDFPDEAETYLTSYKPHMKKRVEKLLKLIDDAIMSPEISNQTLSAIRDSYNKVFEHTNPINQILAWGYLEEILTSPYFSEAIEDDIVEEEDQQEKPCTLLKDLLDSGNFDENNGGHLSLAREFLERHMGA